MSPPTRASPLALIRAENKVASRFSAARWPSELELRRIARSRRDQELLAIKGLGPKALRAFRERYGEYVGMGEGDVERAEDV